MGTLLERMQIFLKRKNWRRADFAENRINAQPARIVPSRKAPTDRPKSVYEISISLRVARQTEDGRRLICSDEFPSGYSWQFAVEMPPDFTFCQPEPYWQALTSPHNTPATNGTI